MNFIGMKKVNFGFFLFLSFTIFSSLTNSAISGWDYDKSLASDVHFWKLVFTQYSKNQFIIHDSENLEIVYKIVTFDSTVSERDREKQLKKIEEDLEEKLLKLADNLEETSKQDRLFDIFLRVYGDTITESVVRRAAKQIRAQQGMRENFQEGLKRALAYLPFIREVFREQKLPEELAYLPHIESSYNPLARSKVGAAGMWQFMRSTARLYMKVNRIVKL
jgi:membrane-bound lytic murein transglycosylase D